MMLMFSAVDVTELEDMRIPCKGYWSVNKSALKAMFGGDIELLLSSACKRILGESLEIARSPHVRSM